MEVMLGMAQGSVGRARGPAMKEGRDEGARGSPE